MPFFGISGGSLSPIKLLSLNREKDIQTMTEKNLDLIFGLKFVCSEFQVGNFRLDTIGFDEEAKSFVIIEYKKDQNFSIIDQGYAYLSLMLNNKADFVLAYNENTASSSKKDDFDWSQSRVIFVSPSFTPYQIEAVNFKDLPIELWEVHLYSNETIAYNKIKSQRATASLGSISKASKAIKNVRTEIKVFSEDDILNGVENQVREAYMLIKQIVYQVNPDVEERIKKSMVCFYTGGKGLIWVKPTKRNITVWLRKGNYRNRDGKVIPEGWGNYPELHLAASEMDAVFIRKLIEQANNLQK
jgi:hypothetical protein